MAALTSVTLDPIKSSGTLEQIASTDKKNGTRAKLKGRKLKAGWQVYHDLGVELMNTGLPTYQTLDEIGQYLGITKQMAYHETAVALGKLAYRMREQTPDWENIFRAP